jgi:hypothetical protein
LKTFRELIGKKHQNRRNIRKLEKPHRNATKPMKMREYGPKNKARQEKEKTIKIWFGPSSP